MCGIAGKLLTDPARAVCAEEIRRMTRALAHRGPDGEGIHVAGPVGLGHRRLAIIDLREIAGQPMGSEDGALWITFNGEIYNYRELRSTLEACGHCFRTASDTEVLLQAYAQWGEACLPRLRGMFAFAIWDGRTRSLFLARDRVGKKPLFYHDGPEGFAFASEAKALLQDPAIPVAPDPEAIHHYLTLGYIPAPLCAFQGIRKLPPAHWLRVQDGRVTRGCYWKLRYAEKRQGRPADLAAELTDRLGEAVRLRLMSDVPLGAFLSGGVDSSAVVAAMAAAGGPSVRTFAVGFEDAAFDERRYARLVAERFGTAHTELLVRPDAAALLPRLVWHYDEPFADASAVPSYCISEVTRRHVTVVLNGDGGDESFAGYDRYVANRRAYRGEAVPLTIRRGVAAAVGCLPAAWRRGPLGKLHRVTQAMALSPARRYARFSSLLPEEARRELYAPDFRAAMAPLAAESLFEQGFRDSDAADWTDATLDVDVGLYLPEDLLVKMDRASMAHGLEARSPFLDHVLMEFAASLPVEAKLHGTQKKWILRESLRGRIPDEILDRPKMGFSVPLQDWFRGPLLPMARDLLLGPASRVRAYLRPQALAALVQHHAEGRVDAGEALWAFLFLEVWHREVVEAARPAVPPAPATLVGSAA